MPDDFDVYEDGKFSRVAQVKGRRDGGYDIYEDGNPWRIGQIIPRRGADTGELAGGIAIIAALVILLPLTLLGLIFWGLYRLFASRGFGAFKIIFLILLIPPVAVIGYLYPQGRFDVWLASDVEIAAAHDISSGFQLVASPSTVTVNESHVTLEAIEWSWHRVRRNTIVIDYTTDGRAGDLPDVVLRGKDGVAIDGLYMSSWENHGNIYFHIPEEHFGAFPIPASDEPAATMTLEWPGATTSITIPPVPKNDLRFWERIRIGDPQGWGDFYTERLSGD